MEFEHEADEFEKLMEGSLKSPSLKKKVRADRKTQQVDHEAGLVKLGAVNHTVDLHGLNKKEAAYRLEQFIIESYRAGFKKLRVITGKGIHSENNISVLKPETEKILSSDKFKVIREYIPEKNKFGGHGSFIVFLKNSK